VPEQSPTKDLSDNRKLAFLLWGLPILLLASAFLWPQARGILWSIAFLWIGGACLANALRCRRAHCYFMGPLFMILGLLSILNATGIASIPWKFVGWAAGLGAFLSFLPEWMGKKYFAKGPAT